MRETTPELKAYVERKILPLYQTFDQAHGPEHVRTVLKNSMELAEDQDVNVDMVYTVAAYHDVGVQYGREDHEMTSGKYLMEDKNLEKWFTSEQIRIMKEAVEDHRASKQTPPRSIYGCIVSEADRDVDPERIVRRCIEFGLSRFPEKTREEQLERAIEHMEEKYGENGYLHLWMPCPKNERGLATLRDWLKTGKIREVCEKYL